MRRKLVAGNWKMNGTLARAAELTDAIVAAKVQAALRAGLERLLTLHRQDPEAARRALPWIAGLWTQTEAAYRPDPSRAQASSLR